MTQTGVPLNATMTPQRYTIAIYRLVTGQLDDTPTRGLDNSRSRDATKRTKTKQAMSPVASTSCPVRELTSLRDVQSASCRVTYRFITNILYKYRQCTNFVRFDNRKRQMHPVSYTNLRTDEDWKRNCISSDSAF